MGRDKKEEYVSGDRPSPVCISVKKFLEMEEQIKSLERNLTLLDLDNQKYKDMCREHYEEMLKTEKIANKLKIDLEHQKRINKELNRQNEALILERNGFIPNKD